MLPLLLPPLLLWLARGRAGGRQGEGVRKPDPACGGPGCTARWPPICARQPCSCLSLTRSNSGTPKGVDALVPLLFTILDEAASPLLPDSMKVRRGLLAVGEQGRVCEPAGCGPGVRAEG